MANNKTGPAPAAGEQPAEEWVVHINDRAANQEYEYVNNYIRTTKYTWWNFLPKNLFEQFHRFANIFFVFIVILNWVPAIQAFGKEVAMIPIVFVLAVQAIKDAVEDRRRARSDYEVNHSTAIVLSEHTHKFEPMNWEEVEVGDIVRVRADEQITADLLLLHSSSSDGIAFLETANLDGETNLKQRRTFNEINSDFDVKMFTDPVICEQPNNRIYEFNGSINVAGRDYPLDTNNILLRGCVLRNTEEVIGVVVYAGHDTKAMRNNTGPRSKRSLLERQMNRQVMYCLLLLLIMCFAGGLGNGLWTAARDYKDILYLPYEENDSDYPAPGLEGFIRFWTFFIILQAMVPISLYVSIELVKAAQVFFIQMDLDMYHEDTNTPMQCRALNINEDLGQIQYVFSDKTGTLTQNKMIFHKCSIGGHNYIHDPDDREGHHAVVKDANSFPIDAELLSTVERDSGERDDASPVHLFLLCLAACNTVVPSSKSLDEAGGDFSKIKYDAESPDEAALVAAARVYKYVLRQTSAERSVVNINGRDISYERLDVLHFDSTRKRMSVVLRLPSGRLRVLCKGADSAIYDVLRRDGGKASEVERSTQEHIDIYARLGLRTLCFAYRDIGEDEYRVWSEQHLKANMSINNRKKLLQACYKDLERDLTLVGATGIEDKLQDGVPDTIESLRKAGVKVWVLTGDKQETAIEIAKTCKLVTPEMHMVLLNSETAGKPFNKADEEEAKAHHNQALKETRDKFSEYANVQADFPDQELALIVDGATLVYALMEKERFLNLCTECKVVVCCRTTPLQKATVVQLVRDGLKVMTLAIGDGANDVSMIQMADVGVGISGQEGMQAVMASDFAIAQFRFLGKLMLVHGHWSYYRIAKMILYFFYKNVMYASVIYWFQFFCGLSGQNAIEQFFLFTFNLLWTSLPVMSMAIFDQDANSKILLLNPQMYEVGRLNQIYDGKFWFNVIDAWYQSLIIFFVCYAAFYDGTDENGLTFFGTTISAATIFAATLHVSVVTKTWNWITWATIAWSVLGFFGFFLVYNALPNLPGTIIPNPYWIMQRCMGSALFWFTSIFASMLAVAPRFIVTFWHEWFTPTSASYSREVEVMRKRSTNPSRCETFCAPLANTLCPYEKPQADASAYGLSLQNMSGTLPGPQGSSDSVL